LAAPNAHLGKGSPLPDDKHAPRLAPSHPSPKADRGASVLEYAAGQVIYSQGDTADSVFRIREGRVKLTMVSPTGREAVMSILDPENFFGENALLAEQPVRLTTATSVGRSLVERFSPEAMRRRLHRDPDFEQRFVAYLAARTGQLEAELADQFFNSAEKRLARVLLHLAHSNQNGNGHATIPKISQETLAQMVGASRARVSSFLNKFRKLGYIEYNGGIHVHASLVNVILKD
jgi:CRP/FNR family transcriptional regulator, cyclic AMP receptor protein